MIVLPTVLDAQKKSKADQKAETEAKIKAIDYSNIVWPNPPAIARIKFSAWYTSDKAARDLQGDKQKKSAWMDRLAGTQSNDELFARPFELASAVRKCGGFKGEVVRRGSESGSYLHIRDQ